MFLPLITHPARASDPVPEGRFTNLVNRFLESYLEFRPLKGVALGLHQFDGRFVVPTASRLEAEIQSLKSFRREFRRIPAHHLSAPERKDLALIESVIAGELWSLQSQRLYHANPMTYACGLDVSAYLKRDFKPVSDRARDVASVLNHATAYLEEARANLDLNLSRVFVELAIESAEGAASFFAVDVPEAFMAADDSSRFELQKATERTSSEYARFAQWLRNERLPGAQASFALGASRFAEMLRAEFLEITPDRLLEIAFRELDAEKRRFASIAADLDPALSPAEAARRIQDEHPTSDTLLREIRGQLETIRNFITERRIVTLPAATQVKVAETLAPFRSMSFASIDIPGPFETAGKEAIYYVTPADAHWPEEQQREWLTAFNRYTAGIMSIHEAYPGHYVQFLTLNHLPGSTASKIISSYAFIEGWAHYAEQMMIEEGFGQPADPDHSTPTEHEEAARFRLAQSLEALLRWCRFCCSVRLHTGRMSVDEATQFFTENSYYPPKPARAEALRGTYDPGYLYYALGKLLILKLREDWKAQEGERYSLHRFHDELLRHGAPPIPVLRQILLKDPSQWDQIL